MDKKSTDKLQWPMISAVEWARDSKGYEIKDGYIARLGGELVPVDLDAHPWLHDELLAMSDFDGEDVVGIDSDGDPIFGDDGGSFDRKILGFVNKYGLLGVGGDAAADREPVQEFLWARGRMSAYLAFAHNDPQLGADMRAEVFNRVCPPHFRVALEARSGRTLLKFQATSMLGWMWLQLAKEKDGGTQPIPCPGCGTKFYINDPITEARLREGTGQDSGAAYRKRSTAHFCSNECYTNHWKREKRKAEREAKKARLASLQAQGTTRIPKATKKGGSK